jgi:hypothetical protein
LCPQSKGDLPATAAWTAIDNAITAKVKQKLRDFGGGGANFVEIRWVIVAFAY